MMRWVQYYVPAFVLVECRDADHPRESGEPVRMVVLATDPDDIELARDDDGCRIYDESMDRVQDHPDVELRVLTLAEQRQDWPDKANWPAA